MASYILDHARPGYKTFSSKNNDHEPGAPSETARDDGSAESDEPNQADVPVEALDIRRIVLQELCFVAGFTIWIFIVAIIDRRVSRIALAPWILSQLFYSIFVMDPTLSSEDQRTRRLRLYKNGKVVSCYQKRQFTKSSRQLLTPGNANSIQGYWQKAAAANTMMSCVGFLSTYIIGKKAWGRWVPDFNSDGYDLQSLLWDWFAFLTMIGLLFLFVSACTVLLLKKHPKPATSPPKLPILNDFPPLVNEYVVYTASDLSWAYVWVGPSGNAAHIWACLVIGILSAAWIIRQITRQVLCLNRLQLCIDWATDVDNVPADPKVEEILASRQKSYLKYLLSTLAGIVPSFGCFIFFMVSDKTKLKDFMILSGCSLIFSYLYLWVLWRQKRE